MNGSGKRAVVVGAGIVGLTSALRLAEAGFAVTVLERNSAACEGTSKANAGQLLYDRIGAMGSAGFLRSMPKTLVQPDQGISVWGLANPAKWPWALAFLRQCSTGRWQENTRGLLEMAARSRAGMAVVAERYGLEFEWRKPGKLILQPTQENLDAAGQTAQFQQQFGGRHQVVSRAECFEREPALKGSSRPIAGGIFLPDAEVGDCRKFGQALAALLVAQFDVEICYGVAVSGLEYRANQVVGVKTAQETITGDVFVIATGGAARELLGKSFAGEKRITGVKGVSLTFPLGKTAPNLSVTDAGGKFVVMRLGDRIRVAGFAFFDDGPEIKAKYRRSLTQKARSLMPQAAQYDVAPEVWVGLRPHTPDDLPMIGLAGAENLFVNAGHGSLGWTLALGSAEILLEKMAQAD